MAGSRARAGRGVGEAALRLLEINLATRPFRNNTLYWAGFGSASLLLAVVTGLNLWLFFRSGSSVEQYMQERATKQQRRSSLSKEEQRLGIKLTKLDFKGLAQQAEFANDAIRRRVFSWTELFNRLEEVVPPEVMMTALRPEILPEGISVIADGMAKDQEALLKLEENLIRSAYFARIYPGSERREQRGGELHFSLKFDYMPAGRAEASPAAPQGPVMRPAKPSQEVAKTPPAREPAPQPEPKKEPSPSSNQKSVSAPAPMPAPSEGIAAATLAPPSPSPNAPAPSGGNTSPAGPTKSGSSAPSAVRASPAPGVRRDPPGLNRVTRPTRPMLHAGMGGPMRIGGGPESIPADGPIARLEAEAKAAGNFENRPLDDVIAYLTKTRSMTFIFDGSFDFRQKVTLDVYDKQQSEIVRMLGEKLKATFHMEAPNTYRVTPIKPPDTLEEPPVEEEQVPEEPPADQEPPKEDGG